MKKMLAAILAALGLHSGLFAADISDLEYSIADNQVTITHCDSDATDVLIVPDTIEGLPVTAIDTIAFYGCSSLTGIDLPDSITDIGYAAFFYCSALTNITLPPNLSSLSASTFQGCSSLTGITLPAAITTIGETAFSGCSSLTNATFEGDAPSMGTGVFENTAADFTIHYYSGAAGFSTPSWNGYSSAEQLSPQLSYQIDNGHVIITDCDTNVTGTIGIPSTIENLPVTQIGDSAFYECSSLTGIILPDSITQIGDSAFYHCSALADLSLPNGIIRIGYETFQSCSSLTNISLPNSLQTIEMYGFIDCRSLKNITLPNTLTNIGYAAFDTCRSLTEITFPRSLTQLDSLAFAYCSQLTNATFMGNAPEQIGSNVFFSPADDFSIFYYAGTAGFDTPLWKGYPCQERSWLFYHAYPNSIVITGCNTNAFGALAVPDTIESKPVTGIGVTTFQYRTLLTDITLPNTLTFLGDGAFHSCTSLTNILLPGSLTYLSDAAFYNCSSLADITLPNSITSIAESTFRSCTALTDVILPAGITNIESSAFRNCTALSNITFNGNAPAMADWVFDSTANDFTIYFYEGATGFSTPTWNGYPCEMISQDSDGDGWSDTMENRTGTNPNDPNDHFHAWLTRANNTASLHYGPHTNTCTFTVERTTDLTDPDSWEEISTLEFSGSATDQSAEFSATNAAAFYRVRVHPND